MDGHRARTNGQPLSKISLRARVHRMVHATIVPRRPVEGDVGGNYSKTALAASAGKSPLGWKPRTSPSSHGSVAVTSRITRSPRAILYFKNHDSATRRASDCYSKKQQHEGAAIALTPQMTVLPWPSKRSRPSQHHIESTSLQDADA